MDDKVYTPEIIVENPFPGQDMPVVFAPTASPAGTYTPTTTKEKSFPKKRTAVELLSTALNTRSRKILEEFELVQSGGIKVGNFEDGISGDLRITPNGITARDVAGIITFAIDGTDGSATFKGTVQANSVIAATIYADNLADDISYFNQTVKAASTSLTGTDFLDISPLSISFTSSKTGRMLMTTLIYAQVGGSDDLPIVRFKVVKPSGTYYYPNSGGARIENPISADATNWRMATIVWVTDLEEGSIEVQVQAKRSTGDETISILGTDSGEYPSSLVIQTVGSAIT